MTPPPAPNGQPARSASHAPLASWLRAFWPAAIVVDRRERARVVVGAALGILVTALVCHGMGGLAGSAWPWLVAPMGASAVLVFGVPASPLAQPWSVVGGNTLSALVGITCVHLVGPPELAAALAVGGAIAAMFALRCLHPPGGATALLVALTGVSDPAFALYPVLLNSLLLTAAGIAYNHATRRPYPHVPAPVPAADQREADDLDADLDAVLSRYNQVLDIGRDDLKALLEDTRLHTYQRKLADIRCSDIMSRALVTVGHNTPLQQAWSLFSQHQIKALPVVDAVGCIAGIVTPANFMRAADVDIGSTSLDVDSLSVHLRKLRGWAGGDPAGVVGRIMTRRVRVVSVDRHLADLIPLFGSTGHHHIPVIGEGGRLVGMLTQTDVMAALAGLGQPMAALLPAKEPGSA